MLQTLPQWAQIQDLTHLLWCSIDNDDSLQRVFRSPERWLRIVGVARAEIRKLLAIASRLYPGLVR